MQYLHRFSDVFWSQKFWLASNVSWSHFEDYDVSVDVPYAGIRHPHAADLLMVLPVMVIVTIIRDSVENYMMKPIARFFGIRETKHRKLEPMPELEKSYRKSASPTKDEIQNLRKKVDLDERQIQRWFRTRRNQGKSSVMKKFCESAWKTLYHSFSFTYGYYILRNEDFFQDTNLLIDNEKWPHEDIKPEFYYYYIVALSYWSSHMVALLSNRDHRRHDFHIMAVHHVLTCLLMTVSWTTNFVRIGMVVLLVHDFADIFLELCKAVSYAKFEKLAYILFSLFYVSWVYTRDYVYPRYVISVGWSKYLAYYKETKEIRPVYLLLNVFLTILFILHLVWTYIITKIMVDLVVKKETRDHRSDSEPDDSADENLHGNENGYHSNLDGNSIGCHGDQNANLRKEERESSNS